ncbi:TPA: AAA family ATPase [Acinetobacter baumannii]|nr:AAA family ATPase [Acinetobacter baumannii]
MNNTHIILEKIKKINNIVVISSEFEAAYKGILLCSEKNYIYKKPYGCLLLGNGGLGKTTICNSIVRKNPSYEKIDNDIKKTIIPVFYLEIPSPATVKSVASSMLKALNDPAPLKGTTTQLTYRLIYLLKECETKLIFMDEFHHLFDLQKTTKRMNTVVCNWIKTLVDETNICFCLVGLPEFAPLLKIDSQLARRFSHSFYLKNLTINKINEYGTMHAFLEQIEINIARNLDITFEPALTDQLMALQIYTATNGNQAYVMLLIENCVFQALKKGNNIITILEFINAWNEGITSYVSRTIVNPFHLDLSSLSAKIRKS